MRKWIIIALLLIAPNANAATKYFNSSVGDGGDGSSGSPYNQFSDTTIAASDLLYCTGTFTEQIDLTNLSNVSIQPYGSGCVIDGQNTREYGVNADRTTNLNIGALEIKNQTRNGIKIYTGTAATTISGIVIDGTRVHDVGPGTQLSFNEYEVEKGTCIFLRTNTSSTAIIDGVTIRNTDTYNCAKHGIDFRFQVRNVVVDSARAWNTGLTATGHGISIHPWKETASSWTLRSGNVYYRNRFSTNDQEQRVVDQTARRVVELTTGSSTNPGAYEWGKTVAGTGECSTAASTGCLYINLNGASPSVQTISVKRFRHGPFLIKNSIVHDAVSGVDTAEGHGFDADDLSGPATFLNNISYNNYGNGFMSFFGERVSFIGNLSVNNGGSGFYPYLCTECSIINNTSDSNSDLGLYDGGTENAGLQVINNIFTNNFTRSAGFTSSTTNSTGFTATSNIAYNNTTNNPCSGFTCYTYDPLFTGGLLASSSNPRSYRLSQTSPAIGAGTRISDLTDYFGRQFNFKPSIGAFEQGSGDFTSRPFVNLR